MAESDATRAAAFLRRGVSTQRNRLNWEERVRGLDWARA